jgi:tRNA G18 (ribose-2'-O)-methylase SpoU
VKKLKADGYSIITADVNGKKGPNVLHESDRLLLALGSETAGPSAALLGISDQRFRIPIARDKAESLNVAAGGAICMYLSSISSPPAARKAVAGKQGARPDR